MARWTRKTALDYLASNPNFTPNKPLDEYTTDYLKRTASSFQKAESEGRAATLSEARGHQRYKHLPARGNRLDQWVVTKPKRREISQQDLRDAYQAAKANAHINAKGEVLIILTGVVQYIPIRGSIPANGVQTLSFWSDMHGSLEESIEVMFDIFDFATDISQLEWETVEAVSFAFPNEE